MNLREALSYLFAGLGGGTMGYGLYEMYLQNPAVTLLVAGGFFIYASREVLR